MQPDPTPDLDEMFEPGWLDRCDWCGWPLVETPDKGCVESDCSMRPTPYTRDTRRKRTARSLLRAARERDELRVQLDAWARVFGSSQLTHASARLEAAERRAEKAEASVKDRDAIMHKAHELIGAFLEHAGPICDHHPDDCPEGCDGQKAWRASEFCAALLTKKMPRAALAQKEPKP